MIHIEIGKSYAGLVVRIGDCEGSIEESNTNKESILGLISDEIDELEGSEKSYVLEVRRELSSDTTSSENHFKHNEVK